MMIILSQIIGAILGCVSSYLAQCKDLHGNLTPGIGHLAPPAPKLKVFE